LNGCATTRIAALCGRVDVQGREREREEDKGRALAGKSVLNRLEIGGADAGIS
jgi:hypothetical protein